MPEEFQDLMQRVQAGCPTAQAELLEQYGPHLIRAVRRRLHRRLRTKFDSMDFAQAVWASFFMNSATPEKFEHPDDLISFLATLARNKVVEEFRRRLQSRKYNVDREQSLDDSSLGPTGFPASCPTPSQVAVAREEWQHMLSGVPEHYQQIIQLRMEGCTHQEVGDRLGLSERTVRRVLARLFNDRLP